MQWSPTEPDVFASCSVDGNIAIWDIRLGKSPAASFKAHNADVNVISWNRCLNSTLSCFSFLCYLFIFGFGIYSASYDMMIPVFDCFWFRLASCMLASGSDDGTFSIRDLRLLKVQHSFAWVEC